jgi:ATP-binding cassette, subfamily B (MDR/TAP), member 6
MIFFSLQIIDCITNMSSFCPDNITLSDIWINHGISHCFLDTVSSSIIAGFIFLFGSAQLFIYRRHATRIDEIRLRPSFLYKFQIFLLLLLAILNVTRLYIHFKFYAGIQIYGFMVILSDNFYIRI